MIFLIILFLVIQASGLSGCIGPLDLKKQHLDKQLLRELQLKHRCDPNVPIEQKQTANGNPKAAPIHIQCKFIADMSDKQKKDKQRYATPKTFHQSWVALDPKKPTEFDDLCGTQLVDKSYGASTESMSNLNRLTFNPIAFSFADLIDHVQKNKNNMFLKYCMRY